MVHDPPSLRRMGSDFDFDFLGQRSDSIEVKWDNGCAVLDDTLSLEGTSSSGTDSIVQELVAVERGDKSRKKRARRRKRRNNNVSNDDDEAMLRRRRSIALVLATCPFVLTSIALAVAMATRSSLDYIEDASTTNALNAADDMAPFPSDAPTYTPGATPFPTYAPTSFPSAMPMREMTRPMTASKSKAPSGGEETHGGEIRTTAPPAVAPRQSFPPASAPASVACVKSGNVCPNDEARCCSGNCDRNEETGEEMCTTERETAATRPPPDDSQGADAGRGDFRSTASPAAAPASPPRPPPACTKAGDSCPNDKKRCCSGRCEKNKETGEDACGREREGEPPDDCLAPGEVCEDKASCCSKRCKKAKERKGDGKEDGKDKTKGVCR